MLSSLYSQIVCASEMHFHLGFFLSSMTPFESIVKKAYSKMCFIRISFFVVCWKIFFVSVISFSRKNGVTPTNLYIMESESDKCISMAFFLFISAFRFLSFFYFQQFSSVHFSVNQFSLNKIKFFFPSQRWARATKRNGLWFNEKTVVRWIWRSNCSLPKWRFPWEKFSGVNVKQNTSNNDLMGL